MKLLKTTVLCIVVLATLLSMSLPSVAMPVWARSGRENMGILSADPSCPVVLEKEVLTYDLPDFPMGEIDVPNPDYSGTVTAEYTFYNPTAEEITMELFLPVGDKPEYYYEWAMGSCPNRDYSITVEGQEIPYEERNITVMRDGNLNAHNSFGVYSGTFTEDDFYSPDLKVTVYTFLLGPGMAAMDGEESRYCGFTVPEVGEGTKVAFRNMECYGVDYNRETNEETSVYAARRYGTDWANPDAEMYLQVYYLGEAPTEPPKPRVFLKWNEAQRVFWDELFAGDYLAKDGYGVEEMTLLELSDSLCPRDSGISQVDWYNALVSKMRYDEAENPCGVLTLTGGCLKGSEDPYEEEQWSYAEHFYQYDYERYMDEAPSTMVKGYAYSLTIGAGERLTHRVQMPVYPSIVDYPFLEYQYLYVMPENNLWPASGEVEVIINTPYTMELTSVESFVWDGNSYTATLRELPEGVLYFDLNAPAREISTETSPEIAEPETEAPLREADPVAKETLKPWILAIAALTGVLGVALLITFFLYKQKG